MQAWRALPASAEAPAAPPQVPLVPGQPYNPSEQAVELHALTSKKQHLVSVSQPINHQAASSLIGIRYASTLKTKLEE